MVRVKGQRFVMMVLAALTAFSMLGEVRHGAFDRLDSLIAVQPRLVAEKEARLTQMKRELSQTKTSE